MDSAIDFLTRREFLGFVGLAGKSAIVVAIAGFINRTKRGFSFTRPPGAREEEVFLSLCLRCDKCAKACPYRVIRPISITESLINAGTPMLDGHCRNCWLCMPACPTGALV